MHKRKQFAFHIYILALVCNSASVPVGVPLTIHLSRKRRCLHITNQKCFLNHICVMPCCHSAFISTPATPAKHIYEKLGFLKMHLDDPQSHNLNLFCNSKLPQE